MSMTAAIETLNQFLTTKYPGLIMVGVALLFAGFTVAKLNDFDSRVAHIENVDVPEIRLELKEIRTDIHDIQTRLTKLEVKVDRIEEDLREIKADIKEMKSDIASIKADLKVLMARKN